LLFSVVTSVRFNTRADTAFLQLQVGKLGALGSIESGSIKWLPLPSDYEKNTKIIDNGELYLTMKKYWFEDRVVTGIQFAQYGSIFSLRIFGKKIEIIELGIMNSKEESRFKVSPTKGDIFMNNRKPGLATGSNMKYPTYKLMDASYICFESNANQDKLIKMPFFDGATASFDIPSPIAGIGMYYYTNDDGYAGYVRPYLVA